MIRIQFVALGALVRRELTRIFRIWPQTLLPSVITTSLYYLIFGKIMGSRIGTLHGVSYMAFIVPGLVMMGVITNAFTNVASSVFSNKFQRNIEEMLISPMGASTIVLGFLSGGILRGMMIGLLVSGVSVIFTDIHVAHFGLAIFVMGLSATFFAAAGFLNACFARKFDDISIIPTFILTPLIYLGGVFYSIHSLPPLWRFLSQLNPIFYIVNSFRYAFLGVSDIPIIPTLIGLSVATIGMGWILWWLIKIGYGLRN